jgi:FdhD protein
MSRDRQKRRIWVLSDGESHRQQDILVSEEPLEIQLQAGQQQQTAAITMRTPGHDYELTAGFLYSEGLIASRHDFVHMTYCVDRADSEQEFNLLTVRLRGSRLPPLPQLERHFFTNSACGICGSTMLTDLDQRPLPVLSAGPVLAPEELYALPSRLAAAQTLFAQTGGLHAAALFDASGELLVAREDIGRHNALDKVIGWGLLNDRLPFSDHVLLVSGRASFELLQKCVVAGVSLFCAVSAPSTLAVALAQRFGVTLVGFLRGERCNIYTHPARIKMNG